VQPAGRAIHIRAHAPSLADRAGGRLRFDGSDITPENFWKPSTKWCTMPLCWKEKNIVLE